MDPRKGPTGMFHAHLARRRQAPVTNYALCVHCGRAAKKSREIRHRKWCRYREH